MGPSKGSYLRLIDFLYHSTLGLRVIKKKKCSYGGEAPFTEGTTRWSTKVSLGPDSGVLRDQICTTQGPKVNCVRHVDF